MGFTIFRALLLVLILSPQFGRGAATSRTRWVPPDNGSWGIIAVASAGGTHDFARAGLGARDSTRDSKNAGPRLFAGLPPCAGRCEDGPQSGTAEALWLWPRAHPAPARIASCCWITMLLGDHDAAWLHGA